MELGAPLADVYAERALLLGLFPVTGFQYGAPRSLREKRVDGES